MVRMKSKGDGEGGGRRMSRDLSLVVKSLLIYTLAVHRHCAAFITKSIHSTVSAIVLH
jgi:hypothetical protein